MRDEELVAMDELFLSGDAYDEHGPYDVDYASLTGLASSSRPTPTAYDDPYSDSYNSSEVTEPASPSTGIPRANSSSFGHDLDRPPRGRRGIRGRGVGERRSRGRARNAGPRHQMSPALLSMPSDQAASYSQTLYQHEEYSPLYPEQNTPRPLPLQNLHPTYYAPQPHNYLQPFGVQPHINPRFASAFGLSMYPAPSAAPQGYGGTQGFLNPHGFSQEGTSSTNWTADWSLPVQDSSAHSSPSETTQ
jgi:H/ACA ribonucleoprotein complex non-core subunit NAF1